MSGGPFAVLLSGGLDSAVLLWLMRRQGSAVRAVTVNYGQQQWAREFAAAQIVARRAGVPHDIVELSRLGRFLPLQGTVVPNRNMILLSVATAIAVAHDLEGVAYAANAGDHVTYPDCRPDFIAAMRDAVALCDTRRRNLMAPFATMTKADVVTLGVECCAPLSETWTCYGGGILHCGKCAACLTRRDAFVAAEVPDQTQYEAP